MQFTATLSYSGPRSCALGDSDLSYYEVANPAGLFLIASGNRGWHGEATRFGSVFVYDIQLDPQDDITAT
jgi:hypothetical protein